MPIPQPWLVDAIEHLDLRQGDRCLMLGCPTTAHLMAVSQIVGRDASIVVVEPDVDHAERASKSQHERLEVLAYTPQASDRFGTIDAVLACPMTTMGWTLPLWAELIPGNLRPGGRFILDLPARTPCEPLHRAWQTLSGMPDEPPLLCGPAEEDVAEALRNKGLRRVETSVGTHLLHLESPYALAQILRELKVADPERIPDLERRLVEVFETTGEVDVVFHRTCVHGIR